MTPTNVLRVRIADQGDLDAVRAIYNQGIEDRIATLDDDAKSIEDIEAWWQQHDARYVVLVALRGDDVVGWGSLNRFSHRCAHAAVADLSVYVRRDVRGTGIGAALLQALHDHARSAAFHKIVLHALDRNAHGKALYRKMGYAYVGTFREHGYVDGSYLDVVVMEKLLAR